MPCAYPRVDEGYPQGAPLQEMVLLEINFFCYGSRPFDDCNSHTVVQQLPAPRRTYNHHWRETGLFNLRKDRDFRPRDRHWYRVGYK
jgi:hypothetical protein